jgi:TRAP-type uncharacterized transport system substrate-binding protein
MWKQRLWTLLTLVGLLVTVAVSAQEPPKRVRIAYPSNTICCLPLFGALQWKVFEANGLQAEIIQVRSQIAYPALAAAEVNYVAGVGPASVSATLRGMQSKAVWFATEELIYSVIARSEFQNIKDLRNKKIALTGLGGTSHVALQIALEAVGENPKNFVYIGMGGAQLLPALESGTVIKSMQAAKQEILRSKEKSVAMIASFLQVDRDVAEDTYPVYRKTVSGNGVPTHEGIDQIIKSLQAAGQFTDRKVTFDEVADDRIAKEVARELGYKIQ